MFRRDLEPLLERLFGARPGAGADRRLEALLWLVTLWLGGRDPAGPVSMARLGELTKELLGGTVAPPEVATGLLGVGDLADAVLPGDVLTGQGWLDLALVASVLRAERGLAPGAELVPGEFADFVHKLLGEDRGQAAALTPERFAAAARRLRSQHELA